MQKKYFSLLIFFLGCCFSLSHAQHNTFEKRLEVLRQLNNAGKYTAVIDSCNTILSFLNGDKQKADLASVLIIRATSLQSLNKLDLAIDEHKKALVIRQDTFGGNTEETASVHLNLGNCYLQKRAFSFAAFHLNEALKTKERLFPFPSDKLLNIYNSLSNFHRLNKSYKTALLYLYKVEKILREQKENKPDELVNTHINFANLWYDWKFPDSALFHLNLALDIQKNSYGLVHPYTALIYKNTGNAYALKGWYKRAIQQQEQCLTIYNDLDADFNDKKSDAYLNIGNHYLDMGDIPIAEKYYHRALQLSKNQAIQKAPIYNSMALAAQYAGDLESAKKMFAKSLSSYFQIRGSHPLESEIANIYFNMSNIYFDKKTLSVANYYLNTALEIYVASNEQEKIAWSLLKLGNVQMEQKNFEAALHNFNKAKKNIQPQQQRLQFSLHYYKGLLYAEQNEFKKSNTEYLYAHKLLLQNTEREILFPFESIQLLHSLSRLWLDKGISSTRQEDFEQAYAYAQESITIMESLRGIFQDRESEINLKNTFYSSFNIAIEASIHLANFDQKYLNQAFLLAEQYRASLFKKLSQQAKIRSNFSLNKELIDREQGINKALHFYKKRRYELTKESFYEEKKLARLDSLILDFTQQQRILVAELKRQHPAYYQLLYEYPVPKISHLQEQLDTNQSVLLFQWGDEKIWQFLINKNDFSVQTIDSSEILKKEIELLNKFSGKRLHVHKEKQSAYKQLVSTSQKLYQRLIVPVKAQLNENVFIIPDGPLCYLPFELLIREPAKENRFFRGHDYLLKTHTISYHYAASFLLKEEQKITGAKKEMLAIAPTFDRSTTLLPLIHNKQEVQLINEIMGGDIWTNGTDSKIRFLTLAKDYRILHFSTHGIMNDKYPEYSWLAFTSIGDSIENEQLSVSEIYDLSLPNTELVVLSACETATGPLNRGEGLQSLSQAFSYAGSKSLLASFWNVDDKNSLKLMQSYYQYLQSGYSKSLALRNAKLDYIKYAHEDDAYPFYWAGFILIGDDAPLENVRTNQWLYWLLAIILLLVGYKRYQSAYKSQA